MCLLAIGPATALTLAKYGVKVDLVPATYIAESVAAALIEDVRTLEGSYRAREYCLLAQLKRVMC